MMHHSQQSDLREIDNKEEEEERSVDAEIATGTKKREFHNQMGDTFKCELCEEEEFDSEIYYRIHMKAHGSTRNRSESVISDIDDDDAKIPESTTDSQIELENKAQNENQEEPAPVPKSSTVSETGRYQLRTTLKPTARSSLLHHMINKSRLNRSGEDVELLPTTTREKRKNEFDDEANQVQNTPLGVAKQSSFSNGSASGGRRIKAKSAKLQSEKESEESAIMENSLDEMKVDGDDAATIVCPICSEVLDTADEESLCTHLGCHREGTSEFLCFHCKNVASDKWKEMQQHLQTHVDDAVEMPSQGQTSEKSEAQSSSSDKNYMKILVGTNPVVCPQCSDAAFASMDEFEFHLEFHDDDERMHCPFCNHVEDTWVLMQPHLTSHTEVPIALSLPSYLRMCKDCNRMIATSDQLELHSKLLHSSSCSYICEQCDKHFFSLGRLACHREAHKSACYECSECQIQTVTLQAMLEHQRIHQGLGVTCHICGKSFPRESQLQFHQKIHRKRDPLTICDQCGNDIYGSYALRYHMQHYHVVVPQLWQCLSCSYVGRTKNNLQSHTDRHHNKPCKCTKCDYSCISEKMLARHIDMFHKQPEKSFFVCQLCPFRTEDTQAMTEHWRICHHHKTNETVFQCPTCKVQFKTQALLKDHMPLHTGKKAYYCKLCVYSAKYRPTMYRHILNKHPGQTIANSVIVGERDKCAYIQEVQQDTAEAGTGNVAIIPPLDSGLEVGQVGMHVATAVSNSVAELQPLNLGNMLFRSSDGNVALPANVCLQVVEGNQNANDLMMMQVIQSAEAPKILQTSLGDGRNVQFLLVSDDLMQSTQNSAPADASGMQFFVL